MPKSSGLFDCFDNLDAIETDSLIPWLKNAHTQLSPIQLDNYLANRILYPQALAVTDLEMKIDLAILREALHLNSPTFKKIKSSLLGDNPFLNITLRKVIIPARFLNLIPDLVKLTWAFVDGLLLARKKEDWYEDLWTVILADDIDEIVGSIILPQFKGGTDYFNLNILNKKFKIKAGSLVRIPCARERCEIVYKVQNGSILGKKENDVEVYGGKLGLIIDGRIE